MAKKKATKKAPRMTPEEFARRFPHLIKQKETPRPAGIPRHKSGSPHKWKPLHELSDNRLHYLMYVNWKGYKIARNEKPGPHKTPADIEARIRYYTEGIDKVKAEMARRGIKDHRNHYIDLKRKATPFPTAPRKLPRYADGLFLSQKGTGKTIIIAPLSILKTAKTH